MQLRPKAEVYRLTKESRKGFDLDVSMFERVRTLDNVVENKAGDTRAFSSFKAAEFRSVAWTDDDGY